MPSNYEDVWNLIDQDDELKSYLMARLTLEIEQSSRELLEELSNPFLVKGTRAEN